jgi:hypothetical protein
MRFKITNFYAMYRRIYLLTLFCLLVFRFSAQVTDTVAGCALPEDSISLAGVKIL